jgi:hypothetical protein
MGKTVVGVLTYADVYGRMRTYAIYIYAAAAVVPVARPDAYRLQSACRRMLTYAGVCGRMLYIYVQLLRWCPSLDQMHTVFNPNADVIYGVLRYSLYALLTYADVCGRMLCIRHLRRPPVLSLRFTSTKVQILTQQLLR